MKTVIINEVFYFFEGIYFWKPLNFKYVILEIFSKIEPSGNLLNDVLHFGSTILFKKLTKEKRWYLSEEKKQEKQNNFTIMISVDGKRTVFQVKLKLQGKLF